MVTTALVKYWYQVSFNTYLFSYLIYAVFLRENLNLFICTMFLIVFKITFSPKNNLKQQAECKSEPVFYTIVFLLALCPV